MSGPFAFEGAYRVQSRLASLPSSLKGRWRDPGPGDLTDEIVNEALGSDPRWRREHCVSLRPAWVTQRSGAFLEPDILYKKSQFRADPGTAPMESNIVDVGKAVSSWQGRSERLIAALGEHSYRRIEDFVQPLDRTVANEYFVHEAGHCLGYATEAKYADGYFRLPGRPLWPLIHLEELRADLLAFGLAAKLLPPEEASALFVYNIMLRLGVHLEGRSKGLDPYGPIPMMLWTELERRDAVAFGRRSSPAFSLLAPDPRSLAGLMAALAGDADRWFVEAEKESADTLDAALRAGAVYRKLAADPGRFEAACAEAA